MFDGLTAWFSASVGQRKEQLWSENGGKEAGFEDAMFLFSEDSSCEDTERIFSSDVYLDEHLSVFHPNYILECIKKGDVRKGVIGKYFLPPKGIQKIGKTQVQYAWEIDGHSNGMEFDDDPRIRAGTSKQADQSASKSQPQKNGQDRSSQLSSAPQPCNPQKTKHGSPSKKSTVANDRTSNTSTSNTVKSTLDVRKRKSSEEAGPSFNQQQNSKSPAKKSISSVDNQNKSVSLENKVSKSLPHQSPVKRSDQGNNNSKDKESTHHQRNNVSNDITNNKKNEPRSMGKGSNPEKGGKENQVDDVRESFKAALNAEVLRLEDLAKVTGELTDFVVGVNGCELIDMNAS